MTSTEGFRAAITLAWLVSPPILIVLAILVWIRARRAGINVRTQLATPISVLAVVNWVVFVILLFRAQTSYGEIFQTSVLTHALLTLSVLAVGASLSLSNCRWPLLFANLLLLTLWVGIAYAPSHFLKHWDYGNVTIDGHPTTASIFIAHPWDSEAEAIVLVRPIATEDFFLSFGQEKVHVASKHLYVRVPGGIWSFPSLREMTFDEPLPSERMNEFRIRSANGGVISVQC
jgi:hypothetical protein